MSHYVVRDDKESRYSVPQTFAPILNKRRAAIARMDRVTNSLGAPASPTANHSRKAKPVILSAGVGRSELFGFFNSAKAQRPGFNHISGDELRAEIIARTY